MSEPLEHCEVQIRADLTSAPGNFKRAVSAWPLHALIGKNGTSGDRT